MTMLCYSLLRANKMANPNIAKTTSLRPFVFVCVCEFICSYVAHGDTPNDAWNDLDDDDDDWDDYNWDDDEVGYGYDHHNVSVISIFI